MSETVLLTGATGFVGRELLFRLAREPGQRIVCPIRARDAAQATARLNEVLDKAYPAPLTDEERSRVSALPADLVEERLALNNQQWDELAATVNRVVHGAASVDWALPIEAARGINVEGTRRVVELAQAAHARGVLKKFDYVSTCYVCGRRRGPILEEDLDAGHGFFNTYEQSKFEAEKLVRASGLPYITFRLSIVVGDSRTGYASAFKVLYWPLKMISRGTIKIVPGHSSGIVDLVPVDYVCEALAVISADPSQRGKTFHLAAGPGRSSTLGEILDLAARSFGGRRPILAPPALYERAIRPFVYALTWGKKRETLKKARVYLPYASFNAMFDTTQARAIVENKSLRPPLVQDYFQVLIDYAIASDWGKRDPGHSSTAGAVAGLK